MTPPPAPSDGLVHAVGFYGTDEEFLRTFVPFCEAGLAGGEATVVRVAGHKATLLQSVLSDPDGVVFLPHDDQYRHPAGALTSTLDLCDRHTAGGSRPVRLLGELPTLSGLSRDTWIRYEAAVNQVLAGLPVRALCACDTRVTTDVVQAALVQTHHLVVGPDGRDEPNARYEDAEAFMTSRRAVVDPLEDARPHVELVDPTPLETRQAIAALARDMQLGPGATGDLLIGVNEVLTNAIVHGRGPVIVRSWGTRGRVVAAIRDAGEGPEDPFAGLLPLAPGVREDGLGLWITHQLCAETSLSITDDGFTVRLAAGSPEDRRS